MHLRSAALSVSSPPQHRSTRSLRSLAQHTLWGCALCLVGVLSLWMCFSLLEKICFHPPQSGRTTRLQQHFTWEWWNPTMFCSQLRYWMGKRVTPLNKVFVKESHPPIYCSTQFLRYGACSIITIMWIFFMAILSSPLLFQQHTIFNSNSSLLHSFPLTSSSF